MEPPIQRYRASLTVSIIASATVAIGQILAIASVIQGQVEVNVSSRVAGDLGGYTWGC